MVIEEFNKLCNQLEKIEKSREEIREKLKNIFVDYLKEDMPEDLNNMQKIMNLYTQNLPIYEIRPESREDENGDYCNYLRIMVKDDTGMVTWRIFDMDNDENNFYGNLSNKEIKEIQASADHLFYVFPYTFEY